MPFRMCKLQILSNPRNAKSPRKVLLSYTYRTQDRGRNTQGKYVPRLALDALPVDESLTLSPCRGMDLPRIVETIMPLRQGRSVLPYMDILDSNEPTFTIKHNSNPAFERHYTVQEIAELWGYSRQTVSRIFRNESGVLKITNARSKNRRIHITLRVPESVLIRMHNRLKS
jgi:hypothetical protein